MARLIKGRAGCLPEERFLVKISTTKAGTDEIGPQKDATKVIIRRNTAHQS
jgi:hypothetical protein